MKKLLILILLSLCAISVFADGVWYYYELSHKDDFGDNIQTYVYDNRENFIQFFFDNKGIYNGRIHLESNRFDKNFEPYNWKIRIKDTEDNIYDYDNSNGTFTVGEKQLKIYFDDEFLYKLTDVFKKHYKVKLVVDIYENRYDKFTINFGEIDCTNFTTIPSEIRKQI